MTFIEREAMKAKAEGRTAAPSPIDNAAALQQARAAAGG